MEGYSIPSFFFFLSHLEKTVSFLPCLILNNKQKKKKKQWVIPTN